METSTQMGTSVQVLVPSFFSWGGGGGTCALEVTFGLCFTLLWQASWV